MLSYDKPLKVLRGCIQHIRIYTQKSTSPKDMIAQQVRYPYMHQWASTYNSIRLHQPNDEDHNMQIDLPPSITLDRVLNDSITTKGWYTKRSTKKETITSKSSYRSLILADMNLICSISLPTQTPSKRATVILQQH